MKSFVMIDKKEYDSHAHIPKREYEELLKKAEVQDKPAFEKAMWFYDCLTERLSNRPSIEPLQLSQYLQERRMQFIQDCEERFNCK